MVLISFSMVDNQEEDANSFSIRLKQNSESFEPLLEDMDIDQDQLKDNRNNTRIRVCHICNKGFSSGKALGGHMRIHFQKPNNKKNLKPHHQSMIKFKNSPTCVICCKDFSSMKSLFGHMRCHPERDWRGIHPPSMANEGNESIDLIKSLRAWPVTAKRGRRALRESNSGLSSLEDDDQLQKAVDHLMMLAANSNSSPKFVDFNSDSKSSDVEKPVSESGSKMEGQDQLDQENMEEQQMNGSDFEKTGSGSDQGAIRVGPPGEGGNTIWRMVEIDLNEVPQSEDEAGHGHLIFDRMV